MEMGSPQHLGVSCREGVREGEEFLDWEIGSPVDTDGSRSGVQANML